MHAANGSTDVVVVGGGLAGLVAATTAADAGRRVVLLDGHPLGGRARCDDRSGYTFNRGPRALYLDGPARPILEALGVDLPGTTPRVANAAARHHGRLHRFPQSAGSMLRTSLLTTREKVRAGRFLAGLGRREPAEHRGETFGDLLTGVGLPPTVHALVLTVARVATYAAEPERLDGPAVLCQLQLAVGGGVRYLDGGFQTLVDGLAAAAESAGVEVRPLAATAVTPAREGAPASVALADGTRLDAATVVLAAGTPDAAAALLDAPVAGAGQLSAPVTAACLELGLRRPPTRHGLLFGIDEPLYLSTHCPPARLAPPGHAVVHVMRNHRSDEPLDPAAQRAWLRSAATEAGITEADVAEERFLARMVVSGGLPTAAGGGLAGRPPVADPARPDVLLAGDWVGDVGLLADGAVASGRAAGLVAAGRAATMAGA